MLEIQKNPIGELKLNTVQTGEMMLIRAAVQMTPQFAAAMFSRGSVLIGPLGHMSQTKQEVPRGRLSTSAAGRRRCYSAKMQKQAEDGISRGFASQCATLERKKKEAKQKQNG